MEYGAVWIRDHAERGYEKKTEDFQNVDMEKNGEDQPNQMKNCWK